MNQYCTLGAEKESRICTSATDASLHYLMILDQYKIEPLMLLSSLFLTPKKPPARLLEPGHVE